MDGLIRGIHHITSIASDAPENNRFFTRVLGLRRVKKTVNFDYPKVYHLYYGDAIGSAGTVMTYFPFPGRKAGRRGTGEVASIAFSIPAGSLEFWHERMKAESVQSISEEESFGQKCLRFQGPDGDFFHLVENAEDDRDPWTAAIDGEEAIRGFHSAALHVSDAGPMTNLLQDMGFNATGSDGRATRFEIAGGNAANRIDVIASSDSEAIQGAGSVHHIAFAVETAEAQQKVREALIARGYDVTEVRDRDYFLAIYFQTPSGILFEVATHEPGFDRDEDRSELGQKLRLPKQHAHLRAELEKSLQSLD